ncbi:unnamed protein product [Caenorhabditis bovis]|uniref:Uncharacterized protein n=1 Tax=Caenorhabditis bovis TaxID=2654633 RepID=A0A8S1EBW5_9PELO|nr:unnamed protein product [Caenorhabditis bovis]
MNPDLELFINRDDPYNRVPDQIDEDYDEVDKTPLPTMQPETALYEYPSIGVSESVMEQCLGEYLSSVDTGEPYPDDANKVKVHHIRVIGALGDSLTIGALAQNMINQTGRQFSGNSFITGAEHSISSHLTIYNILKYIADRVGYKITGGSQGIGYGRHTGFNVAIEGARSFQLPDQADELIKRMKENKDVDITRDWKLISLWIGTNDPGKLNHGTAAPVNGSYYKSQIEIALQKLKENLPRTIVSIVDMFPAELLQEAISIIMTGKRPRQFEEEQALDSLIEEYRKALIEIQNDPMFNTREFAVVVQPFATKYNTPFKNSSGAYDQTFYATDIFHLSKYGHAVIAKNLWQNLFEPVGKKTENADLGDTRAQIFKLTKENCLIRTIGNS